MRKPVLNKGCGTRCLGRLQWAENDRWRNGETAGVFYGCILVRRTSSQQGRPRCLQLVSESLMLFGVCGGETLPSSGVLCNQIGVFGRARTALRSAPADRKETSTTNVWFWLGLGKHLPVGEYIMGEGD